MKKSRKNLKGFTLIELIIALGISTMLLSGALALLLPSNQMYNDTVKIQQQREINKMLTNGINERVRFAEDVIVIKNTSDYPSCTSMKYNDYQVIRISDADYTYNGKTVKGRVFYMDKLTGGTEKKLISDHISGKFSYKINVTASGYDINTEVNLFRVDYKGNTVDKLKTLNAVRLKNYELALNSLTEYDASTLTTQPITGLTIKPSGNNTIILYK